MVLSAIISEKLMEEIMALITLIVGLIIGYLSNVVAMKISFKQRTIDNKIKIYDLLICKWVEMRNHIYHFENEAQDNPNKWLEFDKIYAYTQTYIGEAFLVTDEQQLVEDINSFNEKFYRTEWYNFPLENINIKMEEFKAEGIALINRMKKDIHESTKLNLADFMHIFGFSCKNR